MDTDTAARLEASITHHKRLLDRVPGEELGRYSCPLCLKFNRLGQAKPRCEECPVSDRTGSRFCSRTPFDDLMSHVYSKHAMISLAPNCPECTRLEQAEIAFLESLRDEVPKNECA